MKHVLGDLLSYQTSKICLMIQSETYILVKENLGMVKLCLQNKARFVSDVSDLLGRKHYSLLLTEYLS